MRASSTQQDLALAGRAVGASRVVEPQATTQRPSNRVRPVVEPQATTQRPSNRVRPAPTRPHGPPSAWASRPSKSSASRAPLRSLSGSSAAAHDVNAAVELVRAQPLVVGTVKAPRAGSGGGAAGRLTSADSHRPAFAQGYINRDTFAPSTGACNAGAAPSAEAITAHAGSATCGKCSRPSSSRPMPLSSTRPSELVSMTDMGMALWRASSSARPPPIDGPSSATPRWRSRSAASEATIPVTGRARERSTSASNTSDGAEYSAPAPAAASGYSQVSTTPLHASVAGAVRTSAAACAANGSGMDSCSLNFGAYGPKAPSAWFEQPLSTTQHKQAERIAHESARDGDFAVCDSSSGYESEGEVEFRRWLARRQRRVDAGLPVGSPPLSGASTREVRPTNLPSSSGGHCSSPPASGLGRWNACASDSRLGGTRNDEETGYACQDGSLSCALEAVTVHENASSPLMSPRGEEQSSIKSPPSLCSSFVSPRPSLSPRTATSPSTPACCIATAASSQTSVDLRSELAYSPLHPPLPDEPSPVTAARHHPVAAAPSIQASVSSASEVVPSSHDLHTRTSRCTGSAPSSPTVSPAIASLSQPSDPAQSPMSLTGCAHAVSAISNKPQPMSPPESSSTRGPTYDPSSELSFANMSRPPLSSLVNRFRKAAPTPPGSLERVALLGPNDTEEPRDSLAFMPARQADNLGSCNPAEDTSIGRDAADTQANADEDDYLERFRGRHIQEVWGNVSGLRNVGASVDLEPRPGLRRHNEAQPNPVATMRSSESLSSRLAQWDTPDLDESLLLDSLEVRTLQVLRRRWLSGDETHHVHRSDCFDASLVAPIYEATDVRSEVRSTNGQHEFQAQPGARLGQQLSSTAALETAPLLSNARRDQVPAAAPFVAADGADGLAFGWGALDKEGVHAVRASQDELAQRLRAIQAQLDAAQIDLDVELGGISATFEARSFGNDGDLTSHLSGPPTAESALSPQRQAETPAAVDPPLAPASLASPLLEDNQPEQWAAHLLPRTPRALSSLAHTAGDDRTPWATPSSPALEENVTPPPHPGQIVGAPLKMASDGLALRTPSSPILEDNATPTRQPSARNPLTPSSPRLEDNFSPRTTLEQTLPRTPSSPLLEDNASPLKSHESASSPIFASHAYALQATPIPISPCSNALVKSSIVRSTLLQPSPVAHADKSPLSDETKADQPSLSLTSIPSPRSEHATCLQFSATDPLSTPTRTVQADAVRPARPDSTYDGVDVPFSSRRARDADSDSDTANNALPTTTSPKGEAVLPASNLHSPGTPTAPLHSTQSEHSDSSHAHILAEQVGHVGPTMPSRQVDTAINLAIGRLVWGHIGHGKVPVFVPHAQSPCAAPIRCARHDNKGEHVEIPERRTSQNFVHTPSGSAQIHASELGDGADESIGPDETLSALPEQFNANGSVTATKDDTYEETISEDVPTDEEGDDEMDVELRALKERIAWCKTQLLNRQGPDKR